MENNPATELTRGRLLARNSIIALFFQVIPLFGTLIFLPLLTSQLGPERFGLLTVVWTILAFFGVSDFGFGYVATRMLSERLGAGSHGELQETFWTCVAVVSVVGAILMFAFLAFAPVLSKLLVAESGALAEETRRSLWIVGLCLPLSVGTSLCRGVLDAYQKFFIRNLIMATNGVSMLVVPLVVTAFTPRLEVICIGLLTVRVLLLSWFALACLRTAPVLRHWFVPRRALVRMALKLGGWMTISNIASPLLQYVDRFLIGTLISVSAVGQYTIAYELVTKLMIIGGAITSVSMPAFAATMATRPSQAAILYNWGLRLSTLGVMLPVIVLSAAAEPSLNWWVGPEFASQSAAVLQILAIGVVFNAASITGLSLLLGAGRPDLVAKVHVLELVFFLPCVAWFISVFGLHGAAVAWSIRVALDCLILLWFSKRLMPRGAVNLQAAAILIALGAVALLAMIVVDTPMTRMTMTVIAVPCIVTYAWQRLFTDEEKQQLLVAARALVSATFGNLIAGGQR